MTIGQRAYLAVREMAEKEGIHAVNECKNLEISESCIYDWKRGEKTPNAYTLQRMCLMGYDVIYILTGERKNEI